MRTLTSKLIWMMLAITMSFVLTSCEDDEDIAYTLEGTWEGQIATSSSWDGYTFAISYSQLCFDRDPYRYAEGTGYWVDYYSDARWDYVANHTYWRVENGRIKIYLEEEDYTYYITNYSLTDNYFSGRIYDGDNYVDFDLRHVSSPNWSMFRYYDDYYYRDNYYWWSNGTTFDANDGVMKKVTKSTKKDIGAPHRNIGNADK